MQRACLLAALLVMLLSVGCGKKGAGLSGTFKRKAFTPDVTMTFNEDGTFVGKYTEGAGKGTYKLEGRKLTITTTELNGKPLEGAEREPMTATLSEDGKSFNRGKVEYTKQE